MKVETDEQALQRVPPECRRCLCRNCLEKKPEPATTLRGVDFYFNEAGLMVFTAEYHLPRGHCCESGCLHCPYP